MSANYTTDITLNGSREELIAILKVVKSYCLDKKELHKRGDDSAYFEGITFDIVSKSVKTVNFLSSKIGFPKSVLLNSNDWSNLEFMSDEEIEALPLGLENTIQINAEGPYGVFQFLGEVNLFCDMAEAAPSASFSGIMEGYGNDGDQELEVKLEKGLLYLKADHSILHEEDQDEGYEDDEDEDQEDIEDEDEDVNDNEAFYDTVYDPNVKRFLTPRWWA